MFKVKITSPKGLEKDFAGKFDAIFFLGVKFVGDDVDVTGISNLETSLIQEYIEKHLT